MSRGPHDAGDAAAQPTDAEAVVQRQVEAYQSRNVDAFVACYADDVRVWKLPDTTPRIVGIEALRAAYGFLADPTNETVAEVVRRTVMGPFVVDLERFHKRGSAEEALAIYEVAGGKIRHVWFGDP